MVYMTTRARSETRQAAGCRFVCSSMLARARLPMGYHGSEAGVSDKSQGRVVGSRAVRPVTHRSSCLAASSHAETEKHAGSCRRVVGMGRHGNPGCAERRGEWKLGVGQAARMAAARDAVAAGQTERSTSRWLPVSWPSSRAAQAGLHVRLKVRGGLVPE